MSACLIVPSTSTNEEASWPVWVKDKQRQRSERQSIDEWECACSNISAFQTKKTGAQRKLFFTTTSPVLVRSPSSTLPTLTPSSPTLKLFGSVVSFRFVSFSLFGHFVTGQKAEQSGTDRQARKEGKDSTQAEKICCRCCCLCCCGCSLVPFHIPTTSEHHYQHTRRQQYLSAVCTTLEKKCGRRRAPTFSQKFRQLMIFIRLSSRVNLTSCHVTSCHVTSSHVMSWDRSSLWLLRLPVFFPIIQKN